MLTFFAHSTEVENAQATQLPSLRITTSSAFQHLNRHVTDKGHYVLYRAHKIQMSTRSFIILYFIIFRQTFS